MTTPESHARIRHWFDLLIDLHPDERERRLAQADLLPEERAELLELLGAPGERALTGLGGMDVLSVLDELELLPLKDTSPEGFELEEVIGRGGMGVVFRARQLEPPRAVARKVLSVRMGGVDAERATHREAAVLARLRHPGVAQVIAAGTLDQGGGILRPWYALELVEHARDLLRYADEQGLDVDARLRLVREVCGAVQHGHEKGVLHGDIKPANVLVGGDGRVKVIDFGVARLLGEDGEAGPAGGTPRYMAPELRAPEARPDVRSDVFALGAVLGELVGDPRPRELGWLIAKASSADPERRYPSVAALDDDLARLMQHRPVSAAPGGFVYASSKFARRNARSLVALSVTLVLAALGGINGLRVHAAEREVAGQRARASEEAQRAFWLLRDATLALSTPFEQGRSPEARARALLARLANTGAAVGAPESHASDRQMLVGFGYHALGDLDAARLALRSAADGYAALGVPDDPRLYYASSRLAEVELERGDYAGAEAAAFEALAALPELEWPARERALPATLLARALLEQGAFGEAERVADRVLAAGRDGEPGRPALALARVWARTARGLEPDPRAGVEASLAAAARTPNARLADELGLLELAVGALRAAGEDARARELLEEALVGLRGELADDHPGRVALEQELAELGGVLPVPDTPATEELRARVEEQLTEYNALARGRNMKELAARVPAMQSVVDECRLTLGETDPLTDDAVLFLARGRLAAGEAEGALTLLEGLREAPGRHTGLGPFVSGIYERVWAVTLLELGRAGEAVPIAEECLRKARLQFRDESRFVQRCSGVLEEARRLAPEAR